MQTTPIYGLPYLMPDDKAKEIPAQSKGIAETLESLIDDGTLRGPQGLPGTNGVATDTAVANYLGTEGTATNNQMSALAGDEGSSFSQVLQGQYARAELGRKTYDFDFTAVSPSFYGFLYPPQLSVMQCFVIDEITDEIFVSQVVTDSITGKPESYLVSRHSMDGLLKDHMRLEYGGHGTSICLEHVGATTYIWGSHYSEDGTQNEVVRFPYTPGATFKLTSSQMQKMPKFTTVYTTPVVDEKSGLIGMRFARDGHQTVELRKLADVKNNVNKLLGTVVIPDESSFLQGITLDGDKLYWYSGDTTGAKPREIARYDFTTGGQDVITEVDFGYGPDGKYEDNFREPEGLCLYTDRRTGAKTLFAGVITGAGQSRRRWKVYGYHSLGNESRFNSTQLQAGQMAALTTSDGKAQRLPAGLTSLDSVRRAGFYYLTTGDTTGITDHPARGISGWYFTVYPNATVGECKQTLERNTTVTGNITTYTRFLGGPGSGTAWVKS